MLIAKLLVSIGRNPSVQMAWPKHSRQPVRRQNKLNHSRIKRLNVASELALIHIEGGYARFECLVATANRLQCAAYL